MLGWERKKKNNNVCAPVRRELRFKKDNITSMKVIILSNRDYFWIWFACRGVVKNYGIVWMRSKRYVYCSIF